MNATPPPDEPASSAIGWAGVVMVCAVAVLAAALEALLVPSYVGSTPIPVAVLLALVSNAALPRLGYRLVPRALAAIAPFGCWLVVVFVFGVTARPEGDVIMPGGSLQWVSYGVMLGGALVGTLSVVFVLPPRRSLSSGSASRGVSAGTDRDSPRSAPPGRR